jgi:flagellar hook-associated protein 2
MSTSSTSTTTASTSFKSGSINVSGLGNGTDFNSLIDGLITAESSTKTQLQDWKATWQAKVKGFQTLNTKLLALKTTLSSMDTVNEFLTKTVTSSDTTALSASADSDAVVSSHSVVVAQLAQNDILTTSNGVASLTTTVTTGDASFSFTYAGQSYTVSNIGTGVTLTGLVNFINKNAICDGKIRATTIFDGSSYHLQLYGMDQGDGNQVAITSTSNLSFSSSDFVNTQQAQSAKIKVDGFPLGSNSWISRDSNTVSDVIPGLTLTLKQADASKTINIGITTDSDAIKTNIETFVSAVNEVRNLIQKLTKVSNASSTSVTGSLLTGNYGVDIIKSQLQDVLSDIGLGFSFTTANGNSGDIYSALSQIGISTDADESSSTYGMLLIDDDTLKAALNSNASAVADLFAANYAGETDSQSFSYLSRIDGKTKAGTYSVKIITSAAGISAAYINGQKAGIDGWKVTALTGAAAGMVLQLDNHAANQTFSGNVSLKLGKTGEMVESLNVLTNSTSGPLAILEDNYGDIMSDIDDKIDRETQRLATMKSRLQAQYARLDSLLNTLTNQQTQLTSTIAQLSSSS